MVFEFQDLHGLVKEIDKNELGMVLVKDSLYFQLLHQGATYQDKIGLYADGNCFGIHLYPLMYSAYNGNRNYIRSRNAAVQAVFQRWTAAGYNKRAAKDPYGSKVFMTYLKEIGFHEADWLVLAI